MILRRIKAIVEEGSYTLDDGLLFWRERIIKSIHLIAITFGLPIYFFSIYQGFDAGYYNLIIINTIVYLTVLLSFFIKTRRVHLKGFVITVLAYLIGLSLVFIVGPEANGLIYFIAASVLSSLLLGIRGSVITLLFNILIFTFIAFGLKYNFFINLGVSKYSVNIWIIVSSTTELICLISSIPIAISFNGLGKVISKQRDLQKELSEKVALLKTTQQKAVESDNLKTKFLANMSHEIRTPLNSILGFTELMKHKMYADEEEKENYLDTIHNSGSYLMNLIKNLLDFSIIQSGQLKLFMKPFDINELIKEVSLMYIHINMSTNKTKVNFNKLENTENRIVNSDRDRLKQVLINLINNALKHTDEGEVQIGVEKKKRVFEFYVTDTGTGIPIELQTSIFQRFVKIDGKDKIREGAGLGLPIAKSIIESLNGNIWVNSRVGKGSTFYFTIPI